MYDKRLYLPIAPPARLIREGDERPLATPTPSNGMPTSGPSGMAGPLTYFEKVVLWIGFIWIVIWVSWLIYAVKQGGV